MNGRLGKRKRRLQGQKPNATQDTSNRAEPEKNEAVNPRSQSSRSGREIHAPQANAISNNPTKEEKHWLEYATAACASIAAIGAIAAAIFTAMQAWIANDSEKRQLRAYVGMTPGDVEDFGVVNKQRVRFVRKN